MPEFVVALKGAGGGERGERGERGGGGKQQGGGRQQQGGSKQQGGGRQGKRKGAECGDGDASSRKLPRTKPPPPSDQKPDLRSVLLEKTGKTGATDLRAKLQSSIRPARLDELEAEHDGLKTEKDKAVELSNDLARRCSSLEVRAILRPLFDTFRLVFLSLLGLSFGEFRGPQSQLEDAKAEVESFKKSNKALMGDMEELEDELEEAKKRCERFSLHF